MKKIAIAGSTSVVGIYLKKNLDKEYDVITIGRRNSDICYDLRDPVDNLNLPPDINALICLPALVKAESDNDILALMDTNVQGALKLCMKAKVCGIKYVIFFSSIYALLTSDKDCYGYYSLSKQCAEKVIGLYCNENNIRLCILRPSQIYGDSVLFRKNQPLFYTFIEKAMQNEDITIYGKNDALRNYIYIDDIVVIIRKLIEQGITGVYPAVNPINVRLSDIARAAVDACHSSSRIRFLSDKPSIQDNPFEPDGRLYELLGIKHIMDINEGVYKVVNGIARG